MRLRILIIVLFSYTCHLLNGQGDSNIDDFDWLRMLVDSIEQESDLCNSCISLPEIRSYISPGGNLRFRLRYQCDQLSSTTKIYAPDGAVVGICVVDPITPNCQDVDEFTGYTFGRNISTIWTCVAGFDCASAPESVLFPAYDIIVSGNPCDRAIKNLSVSEEFVSYQWSTPDSTISDGANVKAILPGEYRLIVENLNGCYDTSYTIISVTDSFLPEIIGPTTICDTSGVLLSIRDYDEYLWSTGERTQEIIVVTPGPVYVIVTNDGVCPDTAFVDITDSRELAVTIYSEEENVYSGQTINLSMEFSGFSISEVSSVHWSSDNESILGGQEVSIQFNNRETINGWVILNSGCLLRDEITIDPLPVNKYVFFPNVFNPLSVNDNDRFFAQSIEGTIFIKQMTIYDRWGAPVFSRLSPELNDKTDGWDGRKNGILLPTGLYIYSVSMIYADKSEGQVSGSILLIH